MGMSERSPLVGSTDHTPYVFMTDPKRAYMKRVRQLQCYLCSAIVGIFAIALLVSLVYSIDNDEDDVDLDNSSLALNLKLPLSQPGVDQDMKSKSSAYQLKDVEPNENEQLKRLGDPPSTVDGKIDTCWDSDIKISCPKTAYRSIDGLCNNLNHPMKWGVARQQLKRLIPADYCDDISLPRCDKSKGELPSPALISSKINDLDNAPRTDSNVIKTLWGQFIYQDLVSFTEHSFGEEEGQKESCCEESNGGNDSRCYPIKISKDASYFSKYNSTCLSYRRTDGFQCASINGTREQLNKVTAFLDGSALYGSSEKLEKKLRKFVNGQIAMYMTSDNRFVPVEFDVKAECKDFSNYCSDEGFKCISQGMDLPSFNLLMAKQHNFIANQLNTINPLWTDEKVYQETRKIVAAQIQHITYNEYLEAVLGSDMVNTFGESNAKTGYSEEYDENVDASISNAFATAAFKLLNSFLPENKKFPSEAARAEQCSLKLVAKHIQRGRDHGLPGYTKWREFCNLKRPMDFNELGVIMEPESVQLLKENYKNVDDIDLFVGAFAEIPSKGSTLGPVAICIVKDQFRRLKSGDRFWYETSELPQKFKREQLMEIQKTTLAKIICDNSKNVNVIQYNIMKMSDDTPTLTCSALPVLNFSRWDDSMTNMYQNSMEDDSSSVDPNSIKTFMDSASSFIRKKSSKPTNIAKQTTSFTVNIANITAKIGDEVIYQSSYAKPPITIPLDAVADLSAYTPSATATVMMSSEDDLLQGEATLPLKGPTDSFSRDKRLLQVNFLTSVTVKWGGTFNINPNKLYKCKIMFQSYAKFSDPTDGTVLKRLNLKEGGNDSGEQCNILMVGTFYSRPFYCPVTPWWCSEEKLFYWSGETKLIFTKPIAPLQPSPPMAKNDKKFTVQNSKSITINSNRLGKTEENVVVKKTFASVTVLYGKITGNFNGEEAMDIMTGGPPVEINLDNFINPNSFDVSLEAKWSATPVEDRTITGTFTVPYFPEIGSEYVSRRSFTANFSVDVIYKYGGSIDIIDPSKIYNCKVMFQGNKKLQQFSIPEETTSLSPPKTIKGKTPFGESCSITVSGSFVEPSVFCYLTPWWCSKSKVFQWYGDIELALKYKYDSDAENENGIPLKKLGLAASYNNALKPENKAVQDNQVINNYYGGGYRLGGKVNSGWITYNTGGFFSTSQTLWSGSLPFEIKFPIFWTPSTKNDTDLSNIYGHAVLWEASIFHSTIQGSYSFPQYVGHSSPPNVKWITGKFSFMLDLDYHVSLYDLMVPGVQYQSNIHFHNKYSPDEMPLFVNSQKAEPSMEEAYSGVRAPVILLGKYSPDHKSFTWNGTFIWVLTRTAKDITYG